MEEDIVLLQIADNGKGFENDLNFHNIKSLGFDIIKGLSAQLKGSLEIKHKQGVDISIRFRLQK
jgi:two-component sensor histidine kinase